LKPNKFLHKYPSKKGLEIKSQLAKAIWCQRERWHHLPYVTHIATLIAGQALLMTSQSIDHGQNIYYR